MGGGDRIWIFWVAGLIARRISRGSAGSRSGSRRGILRCGLRWRPWAIGSLWMDLAIGSIILIGILIRRREAMCGVWWTGGGGGEDSGRFSISLSLSSVSSADSPKPRSAEAFYIA